VSNKKTKFVESHWLTFAMKGAISVVAGLCLMFAPKDDLSLMTQIVGWTMFGLAFIEIANVLYRTRRSHNWGFPLLLGAIELLIAVALLYTVDPNNPGASDLIPLRITYLAAYVVFASIVTIVMGFASFNNVTDRFMWVVNGMIGSIIAFMMYGGTGLGDGVHIGMFGTYLMVNGLTDLFFGVHSKEELFASYGRKTTPKPVAAKAETKTETKKTVAKKGKK
jgi:uncharacterized membrane protein HdeD (DUF308 family)